MQQMCRLNGDRAVTHIVAETQIGVAMGLVSRFRRFCKELSTILRNFLLQLQLKRKYKLLKNAIIAVASKA